jgi:ubiquitin carboxyl-terminal hydrolase L3
VVHSVCNNASKLTFDPSSPLLAFARANQGLDAEKLADQLQSATKLHAVTAIVAAEGQTATPDAEDDVNHHFVAFIRSKEGRLLELDGLRPGPIDHGPCAEDDLLDRAIGIIRDDMMTKTSNLNFSALALTIAPEEDD